MAEASHSPAMAVLDSEPGKLAGDDRAKGRASTNRLRPRLQASREGRQFSQSWR